MIFPRATAKQPQINAAIAQVVRELASSVAHIRYEIGHDWSGDWAIFFRVLLTDEASKPRNLAKVTFEVAGRISDLVDFAEIGVIPYFNFRSQSEQAQMLEPAWA